MKKLCSCLLVGTLFLGCAPTPDPQTPEATSAATELEAREESVPAERESPSAKEAIPDQLADRIKLAIDHVRRRDLLTTNAFWTIFHGMLAFGEGTTLVDPKSHQRVNAIEYIFSGRTDLGEIRGLTFIPTKHGLDVSMGPTFVGQGHQDQLLGYLVQTGLKPDRPVTVFGKNYAVTDLINHAKMRARVGQELSWTIVILSQFVGTNKTWVNEAGETISVADLLRSEIDAPVVSAACGGTHRLEGITWALHTHLRRGGKLEGVWKDADLHLKKYQQLAKEMQNPDGSFSTSYFQEKGTDPDPQRRIGTTGHILEFLSMSADDAMLRSEWVEQSAARLAMLFLENQSLPIESGALYHSVHGLVLYHTRRFGYSDLRNDLGRNP